MVKEDGTLYKNAHARLSAYIRGHEMRESEVRDMVLKQVCRLQQPFTAEQLKTACSEERISKGSIYNALNLFIEAGVVQEYERRVGQTVAEYELIATVRSHMQLVCRNCGRRTNFNDKAIMRLVNERKYSNFTVQRFALVVYGECKICRRKLITNKK